MLTNPEEISKDLLEAIGCGLRDPRPCPVCSMLNEGIYWIWIAKNEKAYVANFCKTHDPEDLEGTDFEMSENWKTYVENLRKLSKE